MSIFSSILTLLALKKVSVATKQRLKCIHRYQKRVQETLRTPELTGLTTTTFSFGSIKNFRLGDHSAFESWGGFTKIPLVRVLFRRIDTWKTTNDLSFVQKLKITSLSDFQGSRKTSKNAYYEVQILQKS